MASIAEHKTGWRAQVYVDGKRESKIFRTQREAKAWAATRESELRRQAVASPSDRHTVRDMLERYAQEVSSRKRGERQERLRINAFLRDFPDLSAKKLSDVQTPDIAAWRDARLHGYLNNTGEKVRPVTAASVQRDINWLGNAFSVARKEWQWLSGNPFNGLRMPHAAPPRSRRITPQEVRRICRALRYRTGYAPETRSQEVALAFLVALRTAMRSGEILQLGSATLDMERRVAKVQHKMQYLTGRAREVPLSPSAIRLLRPVAGRERCFTVSSASLEALFRKTRNRLMIYDLHFHDSRAEALTRLSRRVDVMTLARISGHSDLRILQNVYYRETAAEIAARL